MARSGQKGRTRSEREDEKGRETDARLLVSCSWTEEDRFFGSNADFPFSPAILRGREGADWMLKNADAAPPRYRITNEFDFALSRERGR